MMILLILKVVTQNSKSRENFLEILQAGAQKYVLNEVSEVYLQNYKIPQKYQEQIIFSDELLASSKEDWYKYLLAKGISC